MKLTNKPYVIFRLLELVFTYKLFLVKHAALTVLVPVLLFSDIYILG